MILPVESSVTPGISLLPRVRGPIPERNSKLPTRFACGNAPTGSGARELLNDSLIIEGVLLELRQFWIHLVPRLRVGRPDFLLRFIQGRIVQSPGSDALPEVGFTAEQSRTAFRTEAADVVAHHLTLRLVIFRRTLRDLKRVRRRVEDGRVPAAGR